MTQIGDDTIKRCMQDFVEDAARDFDWSMPDYDSESMSYDAYENECMDIGHEYHADVAALAKERMIRAGKLSDDDSCDELLYELSWNVISGCIMKNMKPQTK